MRPIKRVIEIRVMNKGGELMCWIRLPICFDWRQADRWVMASDMAMCSGGILCRKNDMCFPQGIMEGRRKVRC